jgi:hypothetical protein
MTGRLELLGYFLSIRKDGQLLPSPSRSNPQDWMGRLAQSHGVPLLFLPR